MTAPVPHHKVDTVFGQWLRWRILARRRPNGEQWEQKDLAEEAKVDPSRVGRWLIGQGYPRVVNLRPVAKALGCTVDQIIDAIEGLPSARREIEAFEKEARRRLDE